MLVEVCAGSIRSAENAQMAGADRIELCSELAVGGITPSYGILKSVLSFIKIPVHVLIRPRSGNFTYTNTEFAAMKDDIQLCKELGCSGIVSGILHDDHTIDLERTQELIDLTSPLPFTFHRAFDWTPDPIKALKRLLALKVDRVLTSGQQPKAIDGILLLQEMKQLASDKLVIMPGGGVREETIIAFKNAGFSDIHFSATTKESEQPIPVEMNSPTLLSETALPYSDIQRITKMINLVK